MTGRRVRTGEVTWGRNREPKETTLRWHGSSVSPFNGGKRGCAGYDGGRGPMEGRSGGGSVSVTRARYSSIFRRYKSEFDMKGGKDNK